jgi:hypothetical protein
MLEISPRERVGELAFGTARADARAVLGSAGEVFRRAPHELTASESYPGAGLVLGFDLEDRLRTVEMTARAEPVLRGVRLLGRPLDDVLAELRSVGVAPEKGPAGWAVPELGLVLGDGSVLASVSDRVVFDFDFFPAGPPQLAPDALAVRPAQGFAPGVVLGATRADLRELLGGGVASAPDIGGAAQDHFMGVGIIAAYDEKDVVIRLTATGPAQPAYEGMPLLGRTWDELRTDAAARGIAAVPAEAEIGFPAGGFRVWPLQVSGDHPIVAVSLP